MNASPGLFLLGSLCLCSHVTSDSSNIAALREAALLWEGPVTCDRLDCNCAFNLQRGCCCAANEMYQLEDDTFERVKGLWRRAVALHSSMKSLTDQTRIAFKATMNSSIIPSTRATSTSTQSNCFGPFNINVPLPFSDVSLNDGDGFNPSLGIFTAPCAGVFVFSFTVYSNVERNQSLYHKVILLKNGVQTVSVWENNREDGEDSASQVVTLEMQRGDQVYLELMSGRKLCKHLELNIFTGHMLYPDVSDQSNQWD